LGLGKGKMEGRSKDKLPTPAKDSERETRVLLEEVRSDVKVVAEQYGSIASKLKEHDQEFLKLHGRFDGLEHRFEKLEYRFGKFEQQFGAILTDHEHRFKTVEKKLEIA